MQNTQQHVDHVIAQASALTKGGAGTSIAGFSWAFFNENSAAIGAICAIIGVIVTVCAALAGVYYQHKRYKLEERKNGS